MKIAIVGSRNITITTKELKAKLESRNISISQIECIVSGGAIGIDKVAESFAKEYTIPTKIFLPDYEWFGRVAPLKRNDLIVEIADMVVAIWDGESRGTKYTIDRAKKQHKPVHIFYN